MTETTSVYTLKDAQGWDEGLEELRKHMTSTTVAGSTAMFGSGQDVDVVVMVDLTIAEARGQVEAAGYEFSADQYPEEEMFTARRGCVNLIVTTSRTVYDSFELGAKLCKFLHYSGKLDREDRATRVYIHQILRREV